MEAKDYFMKARQENFALGAFNVANLEGIRAVVAAAQNLSAPVIVESSAGETSFFGAKRLVDVIRDFREELKLPIFLNLDHSPSLESTQIGIKEGYDLIHFDGSKLPFAENIKLTQQIVAAAHKKGLLVEGEIDQFPGSSSAHFTEDLQKVQASETYTDPKKAAAFVEKTCLDTLAVFVGNVHGLYSEPKRLDLKLLTEIHRRLPNIFFSLHGGSGIPASDIAEAVKLGVVKINVNSELRVVYRRALKHSLEGNPNEYAVYKYMPQVIEAVQKVVEKKIKMFGSEGKAS